ncbi:aldo/keto reductase [Scenedesmus sp. NREL 46B-D3]|nr:aldo/keto reductase [Scenedesmus sp. NREL 46B-D3]
MGNRRQGQQQHDSKAAAAQKRRKKRPAGSAKAKQKAAAKAPGTIPRVQLTDQLEVSKVIRGCWQLDGQHRGDQLSDRTSGAAAIEDLDAFSRAGMSTLDTADIYGPSEAIVGQYMRLNPAAAMRTKVLTKLSFMAPPDASDLRLENIEYRVRSSIARLGVTTLDLVQLHWEPPQQAPGPSGRPGVQGFVAAAKALQQLQQRGLIGAVGVSNFDQRMLMALLDAGVKPVSNQVSYSVMDRRPSLFLARFCEGHGIPLLAYGTLAGGLLSERYLDVPANMVRIDTVSKARYGTLLKQLGGWSWLQDLLRVLHDVGGKHGVSASCVAARWVLQQPGVAAVVLGARNATHIRDAQRLFSFELDEIDSLDIDAAYEGAHQPTTDVYTWERGGSW